ncbi:hypothetical protein AAF712_015857, partial [Marasmius tenuissimus]
NKFVSSNQVSRSFLEYPLAYPQASIEQSGVFGYVGNARPQTSDFHSLLLHCTLDAVLAIVVADKGSEDGSVCLTTLERSKD